MVCAVGHAGDHPGVDPHVREAVLAEVPEEAGPGVDLLLRLEHASDPREGLEHLCVLL